MSVMKHMAIALIVGLLLTGLAGAAQQPFDVQLPSGSILYFDLASCPSGWTEYTAARGAYVVGLTSGGTKATLVGMALTNQENRSHTHPQAHTHPMTHTHTFSATTAGPSATQGTFDVGPEVTVSFFTHTHVTSGTTSGSSAANTGAESVANTGTQSTTIAPYLQYLLCKKS